MTREVGSVHPDATLQRAAVMMRELDTEMLTVCDRGRLVGVITDRDIAVRAAARGLSPHASLVGDVMSARVVWCGEDQDLEEVARHMERERLSRLPVLGSGRVVVGIVSRHDLDERQVGPSRTTNRKPGANGLANGGDALTSLTSIRDEARPKWLWPLGMEAGET